MPFGKPHNVYASVPTSINDGVGCLVTLLPLPVQGKVLVCTREKGVRKACLDGVLCAQHESHNVT